MFSDMDFSTANSMNLYRRIVGGISEFGRDIKESTERDIMPVYEQQAAEGDYADMLFRWSSLKSVLDSAVGFGLTGLGAGSVVKGVVKGVTKGATRWGRKKLLRSVATGSKVSNLAKKAADTDAYINLIGQKFPNLFPTMGATATGFMTKGAEARMEGLQAYERYLQQYQSLVTNGIVTQEQLESEASTSASEVFDATMKTVIGDILMVKGMFSGKKIISKQLSKPTRWNRNKSLLGLSMLKEGAEEMWQEAAMKEGEYQTYQSLKAQVSDEMELDKIKALNFDAAQYPERYSERLTSFLTSTEALVAGTIGMVSGPLQAKAMTLNKRKQNIKNQYENYKKQQDQYKNNEIIFGAQHKFKETLKQVVLSQDLRKVSQMLNDEVLADFTEDAALLSVTHDNLMSGTTDQLKEVIKEEGSPESTKKIAKIEVLEKAFKNSKRFVNSDEMFNLGQDILLSRQIVEHLKAKANDPDVDSATKESYIKAAQLQERRLIDNRLRYDKMASRKYQVALADEEIYTEELSNATNEIKSGTSISRIQKLKLRYPELIEDANDRIIYLKNIGSSGKKASTKNKKVNITNTSEQTSPDITTLEGQKEKIASKIINEQELTTDERNIANNNPASTSEKVTAKKVTSQETETTFEDNEGNKYNKESKALINNRKKVKLAIQDNVVQEFARLANDGNGEEVRITESMLDEVADAYIQAKTAGKSDVESMQDIESKVSDIYNRIINSENVVETDLSSTESKPDEMHDATNEDSGDIVSQSGKDLLDSLTELKSKEPPTTSNAVEEDLIDHKNKLQKLEKAKNAFVSFIEALGTRDINVEGDFKLFIDELIKATNNVEAVQEHYTDLRDLFYGIDTPSETYHELMNTTEQDPEVGALENSPEKIRQIEGIVLKYVSTTQNAVELMEIYTDDDIQDVSSKNETPAISIAHLSKDYVFEYVDKKTVTKKDVDDKVSSNSIINPHKYNTGTPIKLELHDYDGPVRMGQGVTIQWNVLLKEHKDGTWDTFAKEQGLDFDSTIYDFWPIKITGVEDSEIIGHVHQTNWINKLSTPDAIKEAQKIKLKNFRNSLVKQLLNNPETSFDTSILAKKLERNKKTGKYSGFALATGRKPENTLESLPDNLNIGVKVLSDIEIPGKKSTKDNILNRDEIDNYSSGTPFIFIPLGKKNNKMVYHSSPLVGQRLSPSQSKSIRQAIEIFITDNPEINIGLYQAYKQEGIDLLDKKGLDKVLRKVISLYRSDSEVGIKRSSLETMLSSRLDKDSVGFIEFTGNTIKFGKSTVNILKKGNKPSDKVMRILETSVLPYTFFNINKDLLNKSEKFNFVEVDPESGKLIPYEGDYNSYVKQNTGTYMRSTKLDDGSYSSTIQNITTFDMQDLDRPKQKQKEEQLEGLVTKEKVEQKDYSKDTRVVKLATHFNKSIETFMVPVTSGKITYNQYINAQETVYKTSKNSNKYCK